MWMRLPISVFFMSYSLSLWVPRGGGCGEWPPPVLGAGLHSSGPRGKLGVTPLQVEQNPMKCGGAAPYRGEKGPH